MPVVLQLYVLLALALKAITGSLHVLLRDHPLPTLTPTHYTTCVL
jgi:hypothetical protein